MVERHLDPLQPNQFSGQESQSVAKTHILSSGSLSPQLGREQCSDSVSSGMLVPTVSDTGNEQANKPYMTLARANRGHNSRNKQKSVSDH